MTRRRGGWPTGVGTLGPAVALTVIAAASACAPPSEEIGVTSAAFAITSADVHAAPGDPYPVNLIFVAPDGDPIWNDLSGVAIPDGPQFSPGQFAVERGTSGLHGSLGNLTFDIPGDVELVAFDAVEVFLEGVDAPQTVPVGPWQVARRAPSTALNPTGDYALTMPTCGEIATEVRNDTGSAVTLTGVDIPTPNVTVTDFAPTQGDELVPGATAAIAITFSCDSDVSDFFVVSPEISYTAADGELGAVRLPSASVGLTAVDEQVVERIVGRRK